MEADKEKIGLQYLKDKSTINELRKNPVLFSHFDNLLVEAFEHNEGVFMYRLGMEYLCKEEDEKENNDDNAPSGDQKSASWSTHEKVTIIGGGLLLTGAILGVGVLSSQKSGRKRKSVRRMKMR